MLGGATDVPPRKSCKPYGPMPASHRAVVPFGTVRPAPGTIARVKGSPLEPAETRKDAGGELRDQVTVFWEGGYASCPRPRRGTLVLGRHPSCEIFIDHPLVSRRHASLIFEESSVKIVDLGSHNGTTLAGRRLQPNIPVAIPDGAAVAMGPATMTIRRGLLDSLPLDEPVGDVPERDRRGPGDEAGASGHRDGRAR
jgi:FHA domain